MGYDEQSSCRSEMVPYISDTFSAYYNEPQRMFMVYSLRANIKTAREVCRQEGGRLAAPQNKHMFQYIGGMLRSSNEEKALINYTDEEKEGVWISFDGTPAPSLPWEKDRPDNWKPEIPENCLEIKETGLVNDVSCNLRAAFVCERLLLKKVPKGYVFHNISRIFYKLYTQEKPFRLAKRTCELEGAKLATPEDFSQVFSIIQTLGQHKESYVDFTDEAAEGNFVTSEGRSMHEMEFEVWGMGDPDNGAPYDTPENCVVFNHQGFYMDVPCGNTKPFVCQLIPY